jgi:hypothetical protein
VVHRYGSYVGLVSAFSFMSMSIGNNVDRVSCVLKFAVNNRKDLRLIFKTRGYDNRIVISTIL